MPWGWGRGFRWWYYATGMPGWMRAAYGLPAYGIGQSWPGNPFGFCKWFPWLPRWWWTGIYGPVQWTPQGPILATQQFSTQQVSKDQEVQYLEEEIKALEEEKKSIEQELEVIRKKLEELKKQNKE